MSTPPKTEKEPKFPENFVQKVERLGASVRAATDPTAGITQADIQTFNEQTANQLKDLKPFDAFTKRKRVIDNVAHLEKNLDDTDDNRKIKEALKKLREETQKLQLLGGKFGANRVENLVAAPINTIMQMPTTIERSPVLGVVAGLAISLPIALWILNRVRRRPSSLLRTILYTTGMVALAAGVIAIMGNPAQKAAAEELVQKDKENKVAKIARGEVEGEKETYVAFESLPENLMLVKEGKLTNTIGSAIKAGERKMWGMKFIENKESGPLLQVRGRTFRVTTKISRGGKDVVLPAINTAMVVKQGAANAIGIEGPFLKEGYGAPIYLNEASIASYVNEIKGSVTEKTFEIDAILRLPDEKDAKYKETVEKFKKEYAAKWPDGKVFGPYLHAPVKLTLTEVAEVQPAPGPVPH